MTCGKTGPIWIVPSSIQKMKGDSLSVSYGNAAGQSPIASAAAAFASMRMGIRARSVALLVLTDANPGKTASRTNSFPVPKSKVSKWQTVSDSFVEVTAERLPVQDVDAGGNFGLRADRAAVNGAGACPWSRRNDQQNQGQRLDHARKIAQTAVLVMSFEVSV